MCTGDIECVIENSSSALTLYSTIVYATGLTQKQLSLPQVGIGSVYVWQFTVCTLATSSGIERKLMPFNVNKDGTREIRVICI